MHSNVPPIDSAEVVLPCAELDETLAFFVDVLGFEVASVFPADSPTVAVVVGFGVRLRFEREAPGEWPGVVRLLCRDAAAVAGGVTELVAPNGTRIELVDAEPTIEIPPLAPAFVLSRHGDEEWGVGRAGMRYRDLIPGRLGGRFIASHIRIEDAGPVPDYVHYHRVRFQVIFCIQGWVRVVYEDQGEPFILRAGDCVLQPPEIRHRVLECSAGLEMLEVSCPTEHVTHADPELSLPTETLHAEREFEGQRFVRHDAQGAEWVPHRIEGFEVRDTGIAAATQGLASVHVVRWTGDGTPTTGRASTHDGELVFAFILNGTSVLRRTDRDSYALAAGDAFVVPAGEPHALAECSDAFEFVEVTLPAAIG